MSDLLAIVYPDERTALDVRDTLVRLQRERLISLGDAVVVTRGQDGRVELNQPSLAVAGAAGGALWGTLIGMLFFAPLLGMVAGAAGGAISGKLSDYGIEDNFMKELGAQLQPGKAALFLLVRQVTPDKVLDAVKEYGGTVIRSSLTRDAEARLQQALDTGMMTPSMGAQQDSSAQI
jgi:uncharacterized membrane protein